MPARDQLTNEQLKSLFKSNFDLANYAMQMIRYQIASGHETSVEIVLNDILKDPNHYSLHELADMLEEAKASHQAERDERADRERR